MEELDPTQATFGQRHAALVTVLLVFGLGFLSGAFIGTSDNGLLRGVLVGLGAAALFLVLTSSLAFLWTVVQSVRHFRRLRSKDEEYAESRREPFGRHFKSNLDAIMGSVAQGLTP